MSISFEVYRGSKEGRIVQDKTFRTLQNDEVYIEMTHAGLCGTDEHFVHSTQVLGHEGVGIVRQVGNDVTSIKVGDRVGCAYVRQVCGRCDKCSTGWDQHCRYARVYGEADHDMGSFSNGAIYHVSCVFPIPDDYPSEYAAPLMCAGATVWNCLHKYGVRPTERVGIMGFGGVGHLAVKLSAAIGCHVVVFSRSEAKRADSTSCGASEYHIYDPTIHKEGIEGCRPLKHLLLCGNYNVDYTSIINLMDSNSTIYPLTVTFEHPPIPILSMNIRAISIQGSFVASRQIIRDLLEFVSRKDLRPIVETFPLSKDGIEDAMQKLRDGNIRYRAVLVHDLNKNGEDRVNSML